MGKDDNECCTTLRADIVTYLRERAGVYDAEGDILAWPALAIAAYRIGYRNGLRAALDRLEN